MRRCWEDEAPKSKTNEDGSVALSLISNAVVARIIDRKAGSTYDTASVKGKWGHSKKAFKQWAEMLRKWLDDVHMK